MIADVIKRLPIAEIRRKNCLSLPGQVLAQEGQDVHTGDIIAEAEIYNEILTVDVTRGLGIKDYEIDECLTRQVGDNLEEGDIIAQTEGAFPRLVRAPIGGRILECHDGKVVLAVGTLKITQQAQMIGCIESVIPEYGVNILTIGSLIQGVWGNGLIGEGLLNIIHTYAEEGIDGAFDQVAANQVLVIDGCLDAEIYKLMSGKQLSGLVCTTVKPELIPTIETLPLPVIVLDGFGEADPVDPSLAWFWEKNGVLACVNAFEVDTLSAKRPEIVIPNAPGEPVKMLQAQEKLTPDQRVKIVSGKYQGQSGLLISLHDGGLASEESPENNYAEVELGEGDVVSVSCWNLMIVNE